MKLYNNVFKDVREINGFSKDELLEVKKVLEKFQTEKAEQEQINDFLNTKFSYEILDNYSTFIIEIRNFRDLFLINQELNEPFNPTEYCYLKSEIIEELKLISKNLDNLKSNGRNTKRFLKNNKFLDEYLAHASEVTEAINEMIRELEKITEIPNQSYNNFVLIWFNVNIHKNLRFILRKLPSTLSWEESREIYEYIRNKSEEIPDKKKQKKKDIDIEFYFSNLSLFFSEKKEREANFYSDLLNLLYQNNIFTEIEDDDFLNIIERKKIGTQIEEYLQPIIKDLVKDKLTSITEEIIELDNKFGIDDEGKKIDILSLQSDKIRILLPKLIDFYFKGIEKQYQSIINAASETAEFKNISTFYTEKSENLTQIFEDIIDYIIALEPTLKPYHEIMDSLKKTFYTLIDEITRRKEEYLFYIKTIKNEKLRDNVRNYISDKISEVNELITKYQDSTALIIREEFPQLKQIKGILNDYNDKVTKIKNEIYEKLDQYKEKDVDVYQIIKQWEDNFERKKQQLTFLLSLFLNKIYKSFKDLIDRENMLFDNISDITAESSENEKANLPLNFALSEYLIDKLSGEELDERKMEIDAKINQLGQEIVLYQDELVKIEDFHAKRIKIREGITAETVQCSICHKQIDFGSQKIIKCPFCDAVYHHICVAFWLSKYNSCPSCQNQFLDPNLGLFEEE